MLDTQRNQNCGEGHELHEEVENTNICRVKEPCYEGKAYDVDKLRKDVTPALEPNIPDIAAVELQPFSQSHLTPPITSQPLQHRHSSAAPVAKLRLVEAMATSPLRPPRRSQCWSLSFAFLLYVDDFAGGTSGRHQKIRGGAQ